MNASENLRKKKSKCIIRRKDGNKREKKKEKKEVKEGSVNAPKNERRKE